MSVSSSLGLVIALLAIAGCGRANDSPLPTADSTAPTAESPAAVTFSHPTQLFGGSQEAIDQIEKLNREIPKDPENSELYMQRGMAYKNLIMLSMASSLAPSPDSQLVPGWEAQARADFDFVIERDPESARAYFERATLFGVTNGETAERAESAERNIADLTAAIELDSRNGEYYEYRALNYYELKRYDDAERDFASAIEFTSDASRKADIKLWRGKMYAEQGQLERALKDYDEGLDVLPEYQQAIEEREVIRTRISQK